MDLTIRDWMVVVGVLLIVAVLLDAWRRIRRDRSAEVKMKLADSEELSVAPEQDFSMFGELPNVAPGWWTGVISCGLRAMR